MHDAAYYRSQAERARRMARGQRPDIEKSLQQVASDFDDIAEDLETGAIVVRHPELMPQNRR
jgi:hypothetical protein